MGRSGNGERCMEARARRLGQELWKVEQCHRIAVATLYGGWREL